MGTQHQQLVSKDDANEEKKKDIFSELIEIVEEEKEEENKTLEKRTNEIIKLHLFMKK